MKSKLIKIFTITSQLLLVSIFITIMLENSTFTSEEVVVENANFYKTSDAVGRLFTMQNNNLKLEETIALQKEEVVEELIVVEQPVVEIPKEYRKIYEKIKNEPINADEIRKKVNMPISEVNTILTMLELEGLIESIPGSYFKRKEF